VFMAIFRDEGEMVRCYNPTMDIFHLVQHAWDLLPEDKRWLMMEYDMRGSKFHAYFTSPEEAERFPFLDQVALSGTAIHRRTGARCH
jgi:hypothetical protein